MIHVNNHSNNPPCFQIKFQQHYCFYPYTLEKALKFTIFLISPHNCNLNHSECTKKGRNSYSFCLKKDS